MFLLLFIEMYVLGDYVGIYIGNVNALHFSKICFC